MDDNIHHNKMFYAFTGYLTKEQVEQTIVKIIEESNLDINSRFMATVVKNGKDECLRHGYIFFENQEMYNAFLGFNLDGTERISIEKVQKEDDEDIFANCSDNWADMMEDEEEELMEKKLPPLVDVSITNSGSEINYSTPYTEEQIKFIKENKFDSFINEDNGFNIILMPAKVVRHDKSEYFDTKIHNILVGAIPSWTTEDTIRSYFTPFNTDNQIHSQKKNNKVEKFQYPKIEFWDKKSFDKKTNKEIFVKHCSVIYNPLTADAQFAMNFRKKFDIVNPKTKEECTVYMGFKNKRF